MLLLHFNQKKLYIYGQDFEKNLENPIFLQIFGTISKILRKTRFFPNNPATRISNHYQTLTSCKKSDNSYNIEKNPEERLNREGISPAISLAGKIGGNNNEIFGKKVWILSHIYREKVKER